MEQLVVLEQEIYDLTYILESSLLKQWVVNRRRDDYGSRFQSQNELYLSLTILAMRFTRSYQVSSKGKGLDKWVHKIVFWKTPDHTHTNTYTYNLEKNGP